MISVINCSNTKISVIKNEINRYFQVKNSESIGPPKLYLGNKISKVTLANGNEAWVFSSFKYVEAINVNGEAHLKRFNMSLPHRASSSLKKNYRPETNISTELNMKDSAYNQSLISVLW